MIGYIIGVLLGSVVLVVQNLKPTSFGFRVMSLITSNAFMWGIYYAHMNYWNLLVIPLGVLVLCFISAFCFPYMLNSARAEYSYMNDRNYYKELKSTDYIGAIDCPGLKQTYDRIMSGILTEIATTPDEYKKLWQLLYSRNFYPISTHTKEEVMRHITASIHTVASSSNHGDVINQKAQEDMEILFNTYVSIMSIHEEATRRIEELKLAQQ